MNQLTAEGLETTITSGFQAGTTRTPIMVLMSDGAPTYATNSYTSIGNYNMGNGSTSSTTGDMAFVTQLTASWAKEKIAQKYGDEVEPLFYTLGLGVGSDANALSVMDPNNTDAGATAPTRLIYEVGLRSKIDILNMEDTATEGLKSDANGKTMLHVGTFRKSDAGKAYDFYVREVDTGVEGITYSTKVYQVKIAVYYDSVRNQLTYELVKDGAVVSNAEPIIFTNLVEDAPVVPASPDTGDEGITQWVVLMAVGIAGFAVTVLAMIKRRRNA